MLQTKIKQFEGPLDLLLTLIEEKKLDITQIALAEVTEQFLQHIKTLEIIDPTSLADYLSIASKLLVIKSRAILPTLKLEDEEEEVGMDLESRLILYRQFKEAAKFLKKMDNRRTQSWSRSLGFAQRISFFPDSGITAQSLYSAIIAVLSSLRELDMLPKAKIKEAVSIKEKIRQVQETLAGQIETKLSDLLKTAKNKSDIIITFLALLELIKQKVLTARQENLFAEVVIKKCENSAKG